MPTKLVLKVLLCLVTIGCVQSWLALGAGVTIVTHGFNGNATDWVIPMSNRVLWGPELATNASHYRINITRSGSVYQYSQTFLGGIVPGASPSGEIIVSVDWSTLAGLGGANTATMGQQMAEILLSTSLIPDLNGHSLVLDATRCSGCGRCWLGRRPGRFLTRHWSIDSGPAPPATSAAKTNTTLKKNAKVSTAMSPRATKAPNLRQRLRPINARSAIELHATIAQGACWAPAVVQPNNCLESLY